MKLSKQHSLLLDSFDRLPNLYVVYLSAYLVSNNGVASGMTGIKYLGMMIHLRDNYTIIKQNTQRNESSQDSIIKAFACSDLGVMAHLKGRG